LGLQYLAMFGAKCAQPNRQRVPIEFFCVIEVAFRYKKACETIHIPGCFWMFGPQHALIDSQHFSIERLGLSGTMLRPDHQGQIAHSQNSLRAVGSTHWPPNFEQLPILCFSVGKPTLVPERRPQIFHGQQGLRTCRALAAS
jgi:hypothetical protein